MSLQTLVKAGNITNLSDARYCAAMGVEIMGFPLGKLGPFSLDIQKIKEMTGWLSGVKIALELTKETFDLTYLQEAIEILKPDYLQVPIEMADELTKITSIPLILETDKIREVVNSNDILLLSGRIENNDATLISFCKNNNVLFSGESIDTTSVLEILKTYNPFGIELKGGDEISPGLKSFDELADIFELLEVE